MRGPRIVYKTGVPVRRSPLLAIFLIVLVDVFGLTLVIPLLAPYAEHFGATPLQATLLYSSYAACQFFSGPVLGALSDRYGRRPVLLVSQIGTCLGFLLMARAESLWMVYVARVIDGATAGNLTTAQAYISDNTPPENRAKSFALIGISFGLGFSIGPWVTGMLVSYGLAAPIYLAAALSFTSILCTTFLLPRGAQAHGRHSVSLFQRPSYLAYLRRPVLGGLLVQFFCFMFAFSTFNSGFALFAERRFTWDGHPFTPREIGYLFAYAGVMGIILQGGLIGRLVKRYGEPILVTVGFLSMASGYFGIGLIHTVPPLIGITALTALGNATLRPTLSSLITQAAGREEQGAVIGVNQALGSLAQIAAPAIGGALIGRGYLTVWACVASSAAALGLALAHWGSSR
ncbi:MAG TPA: MFS transporter, partial [Polyangiaceae bacterium]